MSRRLRQREPAGRRAFTLVELIIALVISSILLVGMSGAIMIATRAAEIGAETTTGTVLSREVMEQVTRDLHFATGFSERTDTAATFTVPDRDGDLAPETIRYAWGGVEGVSTGPVTRVYNGGPEVVLADDVKSFKLLYDYRTIIGVPPDTGGGGGGTPLLMVVINADALSDQELARKDLLESWGYAPAPISASASQAEFDAAVAAADVAYVVMQNGSVTLGTKLREAPIGLVNEEVELHAEFGFSGNRDWPTPVDTVEIVDNSHHITEPFPLGDLVIFTSNQAVVTLAGSTAGGLEVLGRIDRGGGGGLQASLAVIDTGGGLEGGGTAAGRRVQMPWGRVGFDIGALNDNGLALLSRSLDWAAGGGAAPPANLGYDTEFGSQVSNVNSKQIATKAMLPVAGTVTSISAFVGGANKGVRYAIYADAGGEPGALLVESSDGNTGGSDAWVTIPVANTVLAPGEYWLALAFDWGTQHYYHEAPGATRYKNYDAEKWGYLPTWGASDDSFSISISIYATYTPD